MTSTPPLGHIGWFDLTVDDAALVRDFYAAVAGWQPSAVPMAGYADFAMQAPDGTAVAGVCHRRGPNADLPAQWIAYIVVADLDQSHRRAVELGATSLRAPTGSGGGRTAFLRDPAGAVFALYQA